MTRARDLADSADKDIAGTVTLDDITLSNDITIADNGKAIFGAGSDLQIYHNGSNSYISEGGTGNLYIEADNQLILRSASGEVYGKFERDSAATFYHNNAAKLATTIAGIDVSGGIVCSPNTAGKDTFELSTSLVNEGRLRIKNVDTTTVEIRAGGDSYFNGGHLLINNTAYSASGTLVVQQTADSKGVAIIDSAAANTFFLENDGTINKIRNNAAIPIAFETSSVEAMRIDSSGRLGLKTTANVSFDQVAGANLFVLGSGAGDQGMTIYSGSTGAGNIMFADGTTTSNQYEGYIQYIHADNRLLFGSNHATRMTIDASGNLLLGTAVTNGETSNTKPVRAGIFSTQTGVTSCANNTATTLMTFGSNEGNFLVSARLSGTGSVIHNTTGIIHINNSSTSYTVLAAGSQLVLSMSGLALQVTQTAGSTLNVTWNVVRIG